ncbi:helix-turn-helix domain-containing protein [Baekduia sp.]|jgi:AcrR family transcriptional regulator|uniref:TetR/AcrR family transcriptional regulator n=1 Tax=Baekduia sp. TaxID=2600305 RepID=UPI002DF971B8|nr:helix-turn-helix domain-containing protein [Baekduia sp.]
MSDTTAPQQPQVTGLSERPKRADARRNYEKLLNAAADAFAENGTATSLEDIARRADVGIGTLYRHFPTRQALLEAVYIDEVEEISRKANDLVGLEPWDALATWLRQFVRYAATKRALADEMMNTIDAEAPVFVSCRTAITAAGDMLLARAQEAGVVRPDTNFTDVGRMVAGIASIRTVDPGQIDRILDVALDGLRYTAPAE